MQAHPKTFINFQKSRKVCVHHKRVVALCMFTDRPGGGARSCNIILLVDSIGRTKLTICLITTPVTFLILYYSGNIPLHIPCIYPLVDLHNFLYIM